MIRHWLRAIPEALLTPEGQAMPEYAGCIVSGEEAVDGEGIATIHLGYCKPEEATHFLHPSEGWFVEIEMAD